ncbi:hypothetical protein ES703_73691 [subsurface metagenome]
MNWIQRFLTAITTHKADASAHHAKTTLFTTLADRWTLAQAHRGADGKIMVFKGPAADPVEEDKPAGVAPPLLVPLFRTNPATGTASTPANINDDNTGTLTTGDLNQNWEVDLGRDFFIYQYRQFGNVNNTGDGRYKLEYYNGSWHDWITNIPVRTTADWSAWAAGPVVLCSKIRLTVTTQDAAGRNYIMELEVAYISVT